jgi:hypothetical protein
VKSRESHGIYEHYLTIVRGSIPVGRRKARCGIARQNDNHRGFFAVGIRLPHGRSLRAAASAPCSSTPPEKRYPLGLMFLIDAMPAAIKTSLKKPAEDVKKDAWTFSGAACKPAHRHRLGLNT